MKKLINLFFLLLMLTTTSLLSCTKDSIGKGGRHSSGSSGDNIESGDILRGEKLYEKVAVEIHEYLCTQDNPSIENVQQYLKKYSPYVASEVRDDILYIQVDSAYEYICDVYGVTCQDEIGSYDDEEVDVKAIIEEINSTLYPDDEVSNTRTNQERSDNKSYTATRFFGNSKVLVNPVCLIWDPWRNGRSVVLTNTHYNVEGMVAVHDFLAYKEPYLGKVFGLVNIRCHGTPEGYMLIPQEPVFENQLKKLGMELHIDYEYGSVPEPVYDQDGKVIYENGEPMKQYRAAYGLLSEGMKKLFPNDLSSTIVWMNMCFSDSRKSAVRKVLEDKKVAAFAGANVRSSASVTDPLLKNFNSFLFNENKVLSEKKPMSAANAAKESLGKRAWFSSNTYYKPYEYESPLYGKIKGEFSFHYYGHVISSKPGHRALSAIENQPRARITIPFEWYESASATRGMPNNTRVFSESNITGGFWIKNKKTSEIKEIEFNDEQTVKKYEHDYSPLFFPKGVNEPKEIARVDYIGITDSLKPGTYEYRTYLEIDGKKEYSDETYEFEVKRINKVVPEWLLEMMTPYIPIYEGDNPPVVEGSYLLSPQTLLYDSGNSYSPGRKFADNMLFFTGQDEVEDTINYVGFEINNNGEIISEKYGEGAFISGEGNNFSIFFNIVGETHYNDGDAYLKEALIISGTKTPTGIKDLYYAFAMVDKYDPYNHLMDIGVFRVFVDGDGIAYAIDLNDESRTRGYNTIQAPLLPSDADNDHSFTYQRGIPFYEWKNRIDMLKRIRIVNGKKVMK